MTGFRIPTRAQCPECLRVFDLCDETDADEWAYGHDCDTDAARDELVNTAVTLDGRPASIAGRQLDYAIVATLDGETRHEWAWSTAARIVATGGDFRS